MPKCIKYGWYLPYEPDDGEYGAWKRHYTACVKTLDFVVSNEEVSAAQFYQIAH